MPEIRKIVPCDFCVNVGLADKSTIVERIARVTGLVVKCDSIRRRKQVTEKWTASPEGVRHEETVLEYCPNNASEQIQQTVTSFYPPVTTVRREDS